jgi:putative transposase
LRGLWSLCPREEKTLLGACSQLPEKSTIDQSAATAAITRSNKAHKRAIVIRQSKHLNNVVEQDHRAVKRLVRPVLGFKSFWAAWRILASIEVRQAIRKG